MQFIIEIKSHNYAVDPKFDDSHSVNRLLHMCKLKKRYELMLL